MGEAFGNNNSMGDNNDTEEMRAEADIWRYVFGFTEMAVVKCAIELGIPDALEANSPHGSITLYQLSSALGCSAPFLYRIMRFLTHRRIFKEVVISTATGSTCGYAQTPLSRLLMKNGEKSMAAFVLLESSKVMLEPWHGLRDRVLEKGQLAFDAAHGEDVWRFAEMNPSHSKLINDAMACDARLAVPAIIKACPQVFEGIGSLVDVGGGDGTALSILVKAFPSIHGINFDLPHVVSVAGGKCEGVEHVGGNMFLTVPKADAVFIMWVLHDWGDEECIKILRNCREAVSDAKGKVMIAEAVIGGGGGGEQLKDVGLMLDMVMMAHTSNGKERTWEEWVLLLKEAGFGRYHCIPIPAVQSLIVAYP